MNLLKKVGIRHPLATPLLMAALEGLRPSDAPRMIEQLIHTGRVAEMLVIEADRP